MNDLRVRICEDIFAQGLFCDNIIKYYDTFMENNTFNILMEYGGDNNLKQFIQNYKKKGDFIEEDIIKDIIIQICEALKIIHENEIIHRDLTPDNIFIDKNNKIKIGDFGIAKILTTSNNYTISRIGKEHYFAPEIIKGEKYNNKIDIYSLGCIIYELFTLNEYYNDNNSDDTFIGIKELKINNKKYNPKWQELVDLLLKLGDKIDVEVIAVDSDKQRVSLSLKNLEPDPWIDAAGKVKEGDKVEGVVTRLKHFGAFIEVLPGVEALLPHNEVVEYQNKNDIIIKVGEKISTYILKFNPDDKRIALSIGETPIEDSEE